MPASGVVEVLSQQIDIHWSHAGQQVDVEPTILPTIISSTSASTLYRACDQCSIGLGLEKLTQIAAKVKLLVLCEIPDNAKPNMRKKVFLATQLPRNILYLRDVGCVVHRIHRIIVHSTNEDQLVGDIHSINFIMGIPRIRSMMAAKLREIVGKDLLVVHGDMEEWKSAREAIMRHTLSREFHYIRARKEDGKELKAAQKRRLETLAYWVDADWRSDRVMHVCKGCCRSRAQSVEQVSAAIEGAILSQLGSSDGVSKNRWGSCTRHLALQLAGHLCHDILNKCLRATFPKWDSVDAALPQDAGGQDDQEDYRKMIRSKTWRAVHSCAEVGERRSAAKLSWTVEPLDHLWRRIQYMDAAGNALADIVLPQTNPFLACQLSFGRMLRRPSSKFEIKEVDIFQN